MGYITEHDQRELIGCPDVAAVGQSPSSTISHPSDAEPAVLSVQVPLPAVVQETYLEVREVGSDYVLTVVELLSPTNKRPGRGRRLYEDKRMDILTTRTHLVEIDPIRAGEPMPITATHHVSDDRILVSRGEHRAHAKLYVFDVRESMPVFPLPLRAGDQEPTVDMGQLLHDLYDQAGYDLRVDYTQDPEPPLPPAVATWVDQRLRQRGQRD